MRTNGSPSFTVLSPRQPITAAPYAITARAIINGAVDTAQLASGAVTGAKVADVVSKLAVIVEANRQLEVFHKSRAVR